MTSTDVINSGIIDYKHVHFGWFLVDWCNYSCSYCNAADVMRETYSKIDSAGAYKLVLERLKMLDLPFNIDLYGGEPTLHPEINLILSTLCEMENCKQIEIKTNLSRSLAFYNSLTSHSKIKISASYHYEYDSPEFLYKCIGLKNKNIYCHISMPPDADNWDKLDFLIAQLTANQIPYDFNYLFSTPYKQIVYSPEFYNRYSSSKQTVSNINYRYLTQAGEQWLDISEIKQHHLDSFKGFKCQARMYEIDIHGEITNICTGKKLPLVIKSSNIDSLSICPLLNCSCDVMLNFYKEK